MIWDSTNNVLWGIGWKMKNITNTEIPKTTIHLSTVKKYYREYVKSLNRYLSNFTDMNNAHTDIICSVQHHYHAHGKSSLS